MVEPSKRVLACNLLAKDNARAALADEIEPCRPKVPLVLESGLLAGGGEGLARA
jgi:hypothetical protein